MPWTGFARDPCIYAVLWLFLLYSIGSFVSTSVLPVAFLFFPFNNCFCFDASFISILSIRSISFIQLRTFDRTLVHSKTRDRLHFGRIFRQNGIFAIFLIQPEFLERPSLCAENSG